jgi:hypothetical protein
MHTVKESIAVGSYFEDETRGENIKQKQIIISKEWSNNDFVFTAFNL